MWLAQRRGYEDVHVSRALVLRRYHGSVSLLDTLVYRLRLLRVRATGPSPCSNLHPALCRRSCGPFGCFAASAYAVPRQQQVVASCVRAEGTTKPKVGMVLTAAMLL